MADKRTLQDALRQKTQEIARGPGYQVGPAALSQQAELPASANALPEALQTIARNYLGARRRSGETLLDTARWLHEARTLASHGDWKIFKEATGTSDDTAERLLNIHILAMQNPQFADAIARNWMSQSAAALLARPSTPPALIADVLKESEQPGSEPPTKASIESRLLKSKPAQNPHSADFADDIPPIQQRGQRQPNAAWPDAPDGWYWNRRGTPAHLVAPDGWQTKDYDYPERALAEAQRRILSQPRAAQPKIPELAAAAPAPVRTDDLLPLHWVGPTRGKFIATGELAKWCGEQRERLNEEDRATLTEEANQLIVELEQLIESLT